MIYILVVTNNISHEYIFNIFLILYNNKKITIGIIYSEKTKTWYSYINIK